ncbi:MAG: hypothetical protein MHPSP_004009, partial [Paramarteilia canceri]
ISFKIILEQPKSKIKPELKPAPPKKKQCLEKIATRRQNYLTEIKNKAAIKLKQIEEAKNRIKEAEEVNTSKIERSLEQINEAETKRRKLLNAIVSKAKEHNKKAYTIRENQKEIYKEYMNSSMEQLNKSLEKASHLKEVNIKSRVNKLSEHHQKVYENLQRKRNSLTESADKENTF